MMLIPPFRAQIESTGRPKRPRHVVALLIFSAALLTVGVGLIIGSAPA